MSTRRSVNDHREAVDALLAPLAEKSAIETLAVTAAALAARPGDYRNRLLAADLIAPADLPTFDNSQMDGYAVSWFDLVTASPSEPVTLAIAAQIAAGDDASALVPGTAAPIMTGAPVPPGADAIVPIEQAVPPRFQHLHAPETAARRAPLTVDFVEPVVPGTFVRRAGSDVTRGDLLLRAESLLGPAQLGVIAGTGLTEVEVLRRLRVLLISTGHEIRDAGSTLQPGQIFDSNSVSLSLALADAGCVVTAVPCRSDDADVLLGILSQHAEQVDLVITIGGVSAGAREVVRDALGPLGVQFGKVAMQPGGPQGFGLATIPLEIPPDARPGADSPDGADSGNTSVRDVLPSPAPPGAARSVTLPVLTLPGNPVSALVSFEMFVRPALRRLAHAEPAERVREVAMIAEPVDSPAGVHQVRRGFVHEDGTVAFVGGPSSHLLHSYASSNALVHIPADVEHLDAGDPVMVWRIDD
ncbi:molybdopterin molybdotransferase MoeA [Subtercola endophyticus]|uniref:molybdopterin molybdotransferase MoeA n=1 Tax=Subtercola endophyticus TaxID=2895559 RepID=UPI001E4FAC2E|nr:molybdopterin molybdotransferase MoeA [Subtercola endophyticus]UFS61012.1 molybdopterin molybdotransferase MoeA [Subtercola endophyticus]